MGRRIWPIAVAVTLVLGLLATAGGAHEHHRGRGSDQAKGLVFAGLERKDHGACADVYRVVAPGEHPMCSHGPDPAPDGIDVTQRRSVADLSDLTGGSSGSGTVPCIGDGTSGARVQAIYAVASDVPDRSAQVAPLIATWAAEMDGAVSQSAAETGGELHLRFVTDANCALDIATVRLSTTGDDSLSNTISELRAKGFDRTDRKYLIWADATVYCGIAQVAGGDSAAATNGANSGPTYGRVDSGCWGRTDHLSELHELMHTLGAVQLSAPHSSGGYHCTDENDAMCYSDAAGVTVTYVCSSAHEWLLDCNHDDYFSTSPPSGSYLATHWNVANSVFLTGGGSSGGGSVSPSPTPTPTPPPSTITTTFSGSISSKRNVKRFGLTVGDGTAANALTFSPSAAGGGGKGKGGGGGGGSTTPTLQLRILASDGTTVLAEGAGPSVLQFASTLPAGSYTWEVSGTSSVSFSLSVTYVGP
jgi:hypothetical protein